MTKARLEAFSDGVIAIIITIMVLELRVPEHAAAEGFHALRPLLPVFLAYVLSFVYIGIYWNNHHHMLHATNHISGAALWANLHLLFWLSLVPFATGWMGHNHYAPAPTALYGVVMIGAAVAYWILVQCLLAIPTNARLAAALGRDFKGKISIVIYAIAIPLAFVNEWIADALYAGVAMLWFVPDRRIESRM